VLLDVCRHGFRVGRPAPGRLTALGAGETAAGAAGILRGAQCPSAALGVVAGADAPAAAFARSRDAHAAPGDQVHAQHVDLDARAGQAAGDGDGLATGTEAIACTGAPTGTAR
jgi:hypothetical protein